MSSTVRIHRGTASPERVFLLGHEAMGRLVDEITDFEVPAGEHVLSLRLGPFHSVATKFRIDEGVVLELRVTDNPSAVAPLVQGGFVRLVPANQSARQARLAEMSGTGDSGPVGTDATRT